MLAVLRRRNFALLWVGGLISMLGDWVLLVALPYHVYEQTGSVLATSGTLLASMLPSVLLGSVAGVFVDRWNRKRILVVGNLIQAVVVLALLVVGSGGWLWVAYAVAFGQSVVARFVGPAESALLPALAGEGAERLVPANALNALNDNLARLVGSALGGALVGFLGLGSVVLVDSLSFVCAAALIALISVPAGPVPEPGGTGGPSGEASGGTKAGAGATGATGTGRWSAFRREWLEGFGVIAGDRVIAILLAVSVLTTLSNAIRSPLMIPFMRDVLQGGAFGFGVLASIQGTGGLLGGAVIGRWGTALRPAWLVALSLLVIGVVILVGVNLPVLPLFLTLVALVGIPAVAYGTSVQTLLQRGVPDRYRGRVFGVLGTTTATTALVGYVSTGILGDLAGTVPMLNVTGGIDILAGLVALLLLRGKATREPV